MYNLLCPKLRVKTLCQIDLESLKAQGISGIIFDLDNTIVPWNSGEMNPDIIFWLKKVQDMGFKVSLVSNNHKRKRVRDIALMFDIPFVVGAFKPAKTGFREALDSMSLTAEQVAVVGDQMFTDILGGNRMGLYTIWVDPLNTKEFVGTQLTRKLEQVAVKILKAKGLLK